MTLSCIDVSLPTSRKTEAVAATGVGLAPVRTCDTAAMVEKAASAGSPSSSQFHKTQHWLLGGLHWKSQLCWRGVKAQQGLALSCLGVGQAAAAICA